MGVGGLAGPPWRARKWLYWPARAARGMDGLRGTLVRYLLAAIIVYAAIHLAGLVIQAEHAPGALLTILLAADPDLLYTGAPGSEERLALLGALDPLAFLAVAAAPFFLYAAVARAVAPNSPFPHPALTRSLRAAMAPVWIWIDACDGAMDRVAAATTARGALAALAIGAYAAYAAIFLVDLLAASVGRHDLPLDPLYGALYAAVGSPSIDAGAHLSLFRALEVLTYLAALAAMPLLANIIARAVAPARMRRRR